MLHNLWPVEKVTCCRVRFSQCQEMFEVQYRHATKRHPVYCSWIMVLFYFVSSCIQLLNGQLCNIVYYNSYVVQNIMG